MIKPEFTCVICNSPVSMRYYFCYQHLHYREKLKDENDKEAASIRFLVNDAAAERMRWLSRTRSRTKEVNFSDLTPTDQRSLGLEPDPFQGIS